MGYVSAAAVVGIHAVLSLGAGACGEDRGAVDERDVFGAVGEGFGLEVHGQDEADGVALVPAAAQGEVSVGDGGGLCLAVDADAGLLGTCP